MAFRAAEAFVVATEEGKKRFDKDAVVPAEIAKGRDALVYEDAPKRATKKAADKAEPEAGADV